MNVRVATLGIIAAWLLSALCLAQAQVESPSYNVRPNNKTYGDWRVLEEKRAESAKKLFNLYRAQADSELPTILECLRSHLLADCPDLLTDLGFSDNPVVDSVIEVALQDTHALAVAGAANAARLRGNAQAIPLLLHQLEIQDDEAGLSVATALFGLGERAHSEPALVAYLQDSPLWMETACRLADELGATPEAYAVLRRGLQGQAPALQQRAASYFMIRAGAAESTFHIIVSELDSDSSVLRQAALDGLEVRSADYGPLSCADAVSGLERISSDTLLKWNQRTEARGDLDQIQEAQRAEKSEVQGEQK
jgi:hypothetical protein